MMKEYIKPTIKTLNSETETLMLDISNSQGGGQLGKENFTDEPEEENNAWKD